MQDNQTAATETAPAQLPQDRASQLSEEARKAVQRHVNAAFRRLLS